MLLYCESSQCMKQFVINIEICVATNTETTAAQSRSMTNYL